MRPNRELRLFAAMQWRGRAPHVLVYISAFSASEEDKQPYEVLGLLAVMQQYGIESDVTTCKAAISACERPSSLTGRWSSLLRCSRKEWSLTPSCTAQPSCLREGRAASQGVGAPCGMRQRGLEPDVFASKQP